MKNHEAWKNFNLGQELSVAGAFIYNGLRRFHEMKTLSYTDELFEVLYNIAVGLERVLKVTVVLLEHDDTSDQECLEKSLITHNHLQLLNRIKEHKKFNFGPPHNELLSILSQFYSSIRYDRFLLSSIYKPDQEREAMCRFLSKYLRIDIESDGMFAIPNDDRYRKFLRGIVTKISNSLYEVIRDRARELNLYTYELRHGSKAETIFLGGADIPTEEILWKELLIFFMNTDSSSGLLEFMRSIHPLQFDPAMANDYLQCFQSDAAKAEIVGELEHLYSELGDTAERLNMMGMIANPNVYFDDEDENELGVDD